MGHSQMNIDSGMPTHFINVTYDGDPDIAPALPILHAHRQLAENRLHQKIDVSNEEDAGAFLDAAGRVAPLEDTKLGLVGSIQHLHLIFDYKKEIRKRRFPS